jgi:hypothetical protein
VSRLAALEASPRVPPHVHTVLVQPLEPPCQQRQLVLSKVEFFLSPGLGPLEGLPYLVRDRAI